MAKKEIVTKSFFEENSDSLFENWINEVRENPHFKEESFSKNENFLSNSKAFLDNLINTVETKPIPDFNSETFEPIFKLWMQTQREQAQKGFTSKDTALLIFSLKTALLNYLNEAFKKTDYQDSADVSKFSHLLDFLGLFTFELYTAEKERLIGQQHDQIKFLEENRLQNKYGNFIGNSPQMNAIFKAVGLVLENDITVLIQGESGTGKELVANIIHSHSKRKDNPFVTLNCGAIPKELVESELFGHEKGAFTGAHEKKLGKFELATGGTLFLDEIGELSKELQVKLLRVLQNKEIERVGGVEKVNIDVRIISATNKDLRKEVDNKEFRLDLYYRLNVFPLVIPPLRDRKDDILPLAAHFIEKYAKEFKTPVPKLSPDAQELLLSMPWEGNVRELENLIQRSVVMAQGSLITSTLIQLSPGVPDKPMLLEQPILAPSNNSITEIIPLEVLEKKALIQAMALKKGNILKTADALGISRTTFYNKAKKYGINLDNRK